MEVALEMSDVFLIMNRRFDFADVWEHFVVRELSLGQAEHDYNLRNLLLLHSPMKGLTFSLVVDCLRGV